MNFPNIGTDEKHSRPLSHINSHQIDLLQRILCRYPDYDVLILQRPGERIHSGRGQDLPQCNSSKKPDDYVRIVQGKLHQNPFVRKITFRSPDNPEQIDQPVAIKIFNRPLLKNFQKISG